MPPAYLLFRASAPSCLAFALALPAFAQWAESKSDPLLRLLSVGLRKTPRLCAHPGSIAPKLSASKNKACPFFGYHINIDLYPDPRPEAEARTDNPKCWSGYYPAGVVYCLDQISIVHIAFAPSRRARLQGERFRGHLCVYFRYGPMTRSPPIRMALSIDFPDSVSFLLTIQATGLLIVSLAGLTPAEYTSLRWTYPDARPCQCTFCSPCVALQSVGPKPTQRLL